MGCAPAATSISNDFDTWVGGHDRRGERDSRLANAVDPSMICVCGRVWAISSATEGHGAARSPGLLTDGSSEQLGLNVLTTSTVVRTIPQIPRRYRNRLFQLCSACSGKRCR